MCLVPNGVLVFADAKQPRDGSPSKQTIRLEHATLEGVAEDEAKRKFAFCLGKDGEVRCCCRTCLPTDLPICLLASPAQFGHQAGARV